jgi:Cd2+/Zn2+-exporting ATPase
MRLGGRACEACALKLESKAQKIEGVRRARATFIGGVMSVTFDNAQLSPGQVNDRVRETGAPVTPFTIPLELPKSIGEWLQYHAARIEAVCTMLTFVFMIAGWFAPRAGLSQTWAPRSEQFLAARQIQLTFFDILPFFQLCELHLPP